MEDKESPDSWKNLLKEAGREFVSSVGESSKQLAAATEKLIADSLKALDDATGRAQSSAATSSEMASAASRAAEEAHRAADSIRAAVSEAGATLQAGEQLKGEVQRRAAEAFERIEQSLGAGQQFTNRLEQVSQTSHRLTSEIQHRIDEAVASIERSVSAGQHAMTVAQQAAEAARQAASEASEQISRIGQIRSESHVSQRAENLVERLEADYQLLAKLVQELQSRIGVLSELPDQRPSEPPPQIEAPESSEPDDDQLQHAVGAAGQRTSSLSVPEEQPGTASTAHQPREDAQPNVGNHRMTSTASPSAETLAKETAASSKAEGEASTLNGTSAPAPVIISGRAFISISPVPDFDRLLGLDSALSRMPGVRNVTLADYVKEEVTFRVEVDGSISSDAFSENLAKAAGIYVEIVSASEGNLSFRLNR